MLRKIKSVIVKEVFLCLFSAFLLILSFPNFSAVSGSAFGGNLWLFAWFGFVPLFFALKNKSKGEAFLISYLTGVIFWLGTIYWLIHVTLPGMIVLVLYLALYFGLFGLVVSGYPQAAMRYPFFIPSVWVLLEYLRNYLLTGFGWALLGYSQYQFLPVIQIADISGAWGVSFLVMMVNVAIYSLSANRLSLSAGIKKYFPVILCMVVSLSYGYYRIYHSSSAKPQSPIKISVIQGNIPQELKWIPETKEYILDKYLDISRQAAQDKPDLIIWPEASLPVILEEAPIFFEKTKELAKEIKTPLLLGAVTSRNDSYYNSALLVSAGARVLNIYDKLHLVPFGEYIPLKKYLPFLETIVPIGDIAAGKEYTIFKIRNSAATISENFAVLICFEDLFPGLSRRFIKGGASFLVNITNDAWYKKTAAAYQHFQASVFRAVENRVFLVRSANTGVSGFIAPSGKILSLVQDNYGSNIFISGYSTQQLPVQKKILSFYTRFGDVFIVVCALIILYAIIASFKKQP